MPKKKNDDNSLPDKEPKGKKTSHKAASEKPARKPAAGKTEQKKKPAAKTIVSKDTGKTSTSREAAKKGEDISHKVHAPLQKLSQTMEEVLEDLFMGPEDMLFEPDLDLFESDGLLVMEAVLPGVEPADLYLRVEPDKVILQGELLASEDFDEGDAFIAERFYGPFQRIVELPVSVDPGSTDAYYKDGILRVEMPIEDEGGDYLEGQDIDIAED